jgi:hypothetical protein
VLARALCDTRARDGVSFSPSSSKSTPDLRGPAFGNIAPDRRFAVAFDAAFDRRSATATVRGLEFSGSNARSFSSRARIRYGGFSVTIGAFSIRMLSCQ